MLLANEIECSKISLEKPAKRSGVSQPTVMRFVKAMGFDGFKEFRYQIIEDLSERNHREKETYAMYGYPIRPEDDLKLIPAKVVASTVTINLEKESPVYRFGLPADYFGKWSGVACGNIVHSFLDLAVKFKAAGQFFVGFNAHNGKATFSILCDENWFRIIMTKCRNFIVIIP